MKLKLLALVMLGILFSNKGLNAQTTADKILIVYFSHSGNTKVIAGYIKDATGGETFEIKPVKDYPSDYNIVVDQAKKEINAGFKPELQGKVADIDKYDVIYVGTPNWWSTMAPPVATFLTSYNLKGKTIIPFVTHGGGGLGRIVTDIRILCPGSDVRNAYVCPGSDVGKVRNDVVKWVNGIKLSK
ncbi:MAG TPA: flavodoxin [Bacteroidales bacterium]|nr:flavodoxin [Bacteroidales bacterium]